MKDNNTTTTPDLPDSLLLAADLRWECRYSQDDQPDDMGRWARKCFYKDIHIAWVKRFETSLNIVRFAISTQFPMNGSDMPHVCKTFKSFDEAKSEVETLWERFRLVCR